jgi:hypothetical protein
MRAWSIALILAVFCVALPAQAGNSSTKAAADSLFREGVALADAGKFADAIPKFRASYELDPARGTLLGLAMAEERAGKLLDAYTHFNDLSDQAQKAGDNARQDIAKQRIAALDKRLPRLTVTAAGAPEGTTITIDGSALPPGAAGSALPVNPGEHRVEAQAPDGRSFAQTVKLDEGASQAVSVVLKSAGSAPVVAPPPKPGSADHGVEAKPSGTSSSLPTVGLVVGGAGVVLLGVGGYLWLDSGSKFNDVSSRCSGTKCPADVQSEIDSGHSEERWARIGLVAGGLCVATGVTLFVIGNQKKKDAPSVGLALTPRNVLVRGRF